MSRINLHLIPQFEEEICWEEVANSKLGKKIHGADGKAIKSKKLNKAKDACVEHQDCNGKRGPRI